MSLGRPFMPLCLALKSLATINVLWGAPSRCIVVQCIQYNACAIEQWCSHGLANGNNCDNCSRAIVTMAQSKLYPRALFSWYQPAPVNR